MVLLSVGLAEQKPAPKPASAGSVLPTRGSTMVLVPAGEFWMGCNEQKDADCFSDEKPGHKVFLKAFYIDKYEATQADYDRCVAAGGCKVNQKWENLYGASQPVVKVAWDDANSYCRWAGKKLPTEAQWEKAARGTDGRIYPWGNQSPTCDLAVYSGCTETGTLAVGSKPAGASPYGALDMAGNAWEWVADWYDENYYAHSPANDPAGPASGTYKVLRGGGWIDDAGGTRASLRSMDFRGDLGISFGFRCAKD
jgi:formylglycine-generating enzyme required for sulfatase activity